ncbi:transglutaminaseTgpA domain-containing protein [Bacillus sp. Marseille-Q1617]|uniref:transglutaminase TgpA family protein n=1 Tax=Bacillus sp. Marseille-Q1617 TaxID=2736887 RepID=UPI00158D6D51|nr:transglutaminaseTgpA domain-containing protein [Bacillus sp. Marseille-Q1617]
MSGKASANRFYSVLIYLFGFLLLWEWLKPLKVVTDTGDLTYFIIFIALSLTLSYFGVHYLLSGMVKTIFIMISLHALYIPGSLFDLAWLGVFAKDLWHNLGLTIGRDWSGLSFVYRSLLFFILLWLMTYLIYYWLSVRKAILLFYIMTVTYISVMDTFTVYEGDKAIIRIVVFGFLLMGLLALERLIQGEKLLGSKMSRHRWIVPLTVLLGVSSVVAFAAPKADPIWPDPVPYIKSFAEGSGGLQGVSKLGYDTDDSKLGGPFIGDPTIVFTAEVAREHYWRIETKDLYTGKGWEQSMEEEAGVPFRSDEELPFSLNPKNEERELQTEKVMIEEAYPHVVYPYGVEKVTGNEEGSFEFMPVNEKIRSFDEAGESVRLEEYTLDYRYPSYSQKGMRAANAEQEVMQVPEFVERYTQIPESTPQRVKDLAVEITQDEADWYDKVRAIEGYFEKEAFVYDQFDVAVPEENQDYVDQFLFETQRGYCDNFSTSMVVMVRSLGIPARWVKGYTEGDYRRQIDSEYKLYEVSNNNAHSWVEVFFPEVGWVPFEPTVGFNSNIAYEYDLDLEDAEEDQVPVPEKETPKKPLEPEVDETTNESGFSIKDLWDDIKTFFAENWGKILIGFILLAVAAALAYIYRRRWLPYFLILYYRRRKSEDVYSEAYISLVKQLGRYGLKMQDGQTLRGFSRYIDSFFGTYEMTSLTNRYERTLYGHKPDQEDWVKMRELWENLIKRTTG